MVLDSGLSFNINRTVCAGKIHCVSAWRSVNLGLFSYGLYSRWPKPTSSRHDEVTTQHETQPNRTNLTKGCSSNEMNEHVWFGDWMKWNCVRCGVWLCRIKWKTMLVRGEAPQKSYILTGVKYWSYIQNYNYNLTI